MAQNLIEFFKKYTAEGARYAWMNEAQVVSARVDKERRIIEMRVHLPYTIDKDELYATENDIAEAYKINSVKIIPNYRAELFDEEYVEEILKEAGRTRAEARCFFENCEYSLKGDTLSIKVRYSTSSFYYLENLKTPELIENIIFSEFGRNVSVEIIASENDEYDRIHDAEYYKKIEDMERNFAEAAIEYDRRVAEAKKQKEQKEPDEDNKLPRATSLNPDGATPKLTDKLVRIGSYEFDISSPDFVIGKPFNIVPKSIAELDDGKAHTNVTVVGKVFEYKAEPTKKGNGMKVSFSIFDGNTSIECRMYMTPEECSDFEKKINVGAVIAMHGNAKHATINKKIDEDVTFSFDDIAKISLIERSDNAERKRVELHLHTNMSTMDAIIPPDKVVEQAKKWGMSAIAVTDHANVQAYPELMKKAAKLGGIKVIYGLEAYFVNNESSAVYGKCNCDFNDEAVVFDIETTGLSALNCKIIEIGAVRIKNGVVLETFDEFVNPGEKIPKEITELTSITDKDVEKADGIEKVLRRFLDFAKDCLLIAHNANFDTGFIRAAAEKCGYEFKNPYLDTFALSRFINNDLKTHKLDVIAKYYGLGDFNHHRASDDAAILAEIYFRMVEKLQKYNIHNVAQLHREMTANSDPLVLPTYHQIILVKNKVGLKNLYKLVSYGYLNYYRKHPRIPKTVLNEHREGLIIGSACESGELYRAILEGLPDSDIESIVNYYDYLEIQPLSNNRFLVEEGRLANDEALRDINRKIVALGEKYNKPVVATCDAHFLEDGDEIYRKILLTGMKFKDAHRDTHLYLRTTEEMLEEFSYLGEKKAYEVVVENTNRIADMIEEIKPIPDGTYTPDIPGSEEELTRLCYEKAHKIYGENLPEIVEKRLKRELDAIIGNGYAVLYMIAQKLVKFSEDNGYLVGSRGSVGSSLVANLSGISEVDPLEPHYVCPKCHKSIFYTNGEYGSGFDLPDKLCDECGTPMNADGHSIPFETFLGFKGDKTPDIDLNFSGDVQGKVHKYTEELFGSENVFRAGTLGTLAEKTAYGFVMKYLEEQGVSLSRAEVERLLLGCVGVKRTTGQHPGGIIVIPRQYEIYDFTPIQHPADDPKSETITTHFAFSYLHDTILKLDELGHDIPTKYKYIEKYSGMSVMDVKMNDRSVYELFSSTAPLGASADAVGSNVGTFGLPEFGTSLVRSVVEESKPKTFADLLQVSGITHGTDVWTGNAQDLINSGTCTISQVIGCRDNIMLDLIRYGVDNALSFKIMEFVRKNKKGLPIPQEMVDAMREHGVPEWYIGSCQKIKYMFPKAHAAAYVMSAIRVGWFKVHKPTAFYCAMFTAAPDGFDAEIAMSGKSGVVGELNRIKKLGREASQKEKGMVSTLELINECYARRIKFLPVSLEKSDSKEFLPEGEGAIRLPFFSLNGLGETAAEQIVAERNKSPFFSVEDLQTRAGLNKSVIDNLRANHILDGLSETDQISMF